MSLLPWLSLLTACEIPDRVPPDDTAGEGCGAWPLACPTCTFDDDRADADGIERVYRCDDDGRLLDAVMRTDPASLHDTHFYGADDGLRVAAQRLYSEDPGPCRDVDDEWWGEVLPACAPVCEHEVHPFSDPDLPPC